MVFWFCAGAERVPTGCWGAAEEVLGRCWEGAGGVPKGDAKYLIKPYENEPLLGTFPKGYQKRHQKQLAFPCLRDVAGRLGKTSKNN